MRKELLLKQKMMVRYETIYPIDGKIQCNFSIAESADKDELQNKKAIIAIKENLIGFTDSLENKLFLHEGALIELDSDSYRPICRVYFFLFNDLLIIGKVKHDKYVCSNEIHTFNFEINKFSYLIIVVHRVLEYASQYDATRIAVINIKDLDGVKNAINVITPDGAKIFQCISASTKNEWIDKFETALKYNQLKKKKGMAAKPSPNVKTKPAEARISRSATHSSVASNSTVTTLSPTSTLGEQDMPMINNGPDWLTTAHEEIHTLIAQRHFEDALALIIKCEEYFTKDSAFFNSSETIDKVRPI